MYLEKCPPGMPISGTAVRARRPAGPLPRRAAASAAFRGALVAVGLLTVGLFIVGGLGLAWVWARWSYPLLDLRQGKLPTVRLYAGSEEIAALQGTSRRFQIWLPLDEIPRPVVNAVLAAEDRRFFQHPGIDVRAVLRAAVANLRRGGARP